MSPYDPWGCEHRADTSKWRKDLKLMLVTIVVDECVPTGSENARSAIPKAIPTNNGGMALTDSFGPGLRVIMRSSTLHNHGSIDEVSR